MYVFIVCIWQTNTSFFFKYDLTIFLTLTTDNWQQGSLSEKSKPWRMVDRLMQHRFVTNILLILILWCILPGISWISPQIPQICPFFPNMALFPLKLKPQNRFWCQKAEICKISLIWNLDSSDSKINSKLLEFRKFFLFDIRSRSGTSIWVGKVSCLGRKAKYVIFAERFQRFQKIP